LAAYSFISITLEVSLGLPFMPTAQVCDGSQSFRPYIVTSTFKSTWDTLNLGLTTVRVHALIFRPRLLSPSKTLCLGGGTDGH